MDDKLENTLGRWAGENGLSIGEYLAIKGRLQRMKKENNNKKKKLCEKLNERGTGILAVPGGAVTAVLRTHEGCCV